MGSLKYCCEQAGNMKRKQDRNATQYKSVTNPIFGSDLHSLPLTSKKNGRENMAPQNSVGSKKAVKAGAKKASAATKKTPTLWTGRLKNNPGSSRKTPAPVKKATLRKTGDKMIKKTLGKKGKEMAIKGGAKKTLGRGGKASAGGVGAFDLEAFVKVKFSNLEKTAHQKKV